MKFLVLTQPSRSISHKAIDVASCFATRSPSDENMVALAGKQIAKKFAAVLSLPG